MFVAAAVTFGRAVRCKGVVSASWHHSVAQWPDATMCMQTQSFLTNTSHFARIVFSTVAPPIRVDSLCDSVPVCACVYVRVCVTYRTNHFHTYVHIT